MDKVTYDDYFAYMQNSEDGRNAIEYTQNKEKSLDVIKSQKWYHKIFNKLKELFRK